MQRIFGFYRDSRGMAAAGAQVRVYNFGTTTLATIYDDEPSANPVVPKANPFTTDSNGYWVFAAPTGAYTIQFNGANLPVYTINRFYLDEGGGGSGSVAWGAITGTVTDQTDLVSYIAGLGYITGNENITISGDASGSGTTSIPLTIATFGAANRGFAPASGGGTTNFLRADGTWAAPSFTTTWGSITGTLSSQSDLQTALNLKYDASNPSGYISGNQNITLSGDATGSGTTAITVAINTFAGSTKGLVPTSLGGTTNFLRADGSWAAPPGGAGSTWTEIEIDFGSKPVYSKTFAVTDGTVSGTSKIQVVPCGKPATGGFEDDWEWDNISLAANPGTGTFNLMAAAMPGPVSGKRKVQYSVV